MSSSSAAADQDRPAASRSRRASIRLAPSPCWNLCHLLVLYGTTMLIPIHFQQTVEAFETSKAGFRPMRCSGTGACFRRRIRWIPSSSPQTRLLATVPSHDAAQQTVQNATAEKGAISTSISELANIVGGTGRSKLIWDCYKIGIDPALYYTTSSSSPGDNNSYDDDTAQRVIAATTESLRTERPESNICNVTMYDTPLKRQEAIAAEITKQLPTSRYGLKLGRDALNHLATTYQSSLGYANTAPRIEGGIASLSHLSVSSDGTTKLLLRLRDGLEVETVIIPWHKNKYSTCCISSQVGCRQGCTFCATGRMGRVRNLSSEEILAQYFWAVKVCRLSRLLVGQKGSETGDVKDDGVVVGQSSKPSLSLPDISRVVFMGITEPSDAADEVNAALVILTDETLYHLSPTKVTVSTVAPSPEAFAAFADSPCVLAWSVHAANNELRRKLVPTTKYNMEELRQGLVEALLRKPEKLRNTIMLEIALIDGLNDGIEQANELADLAWRIVDDVPNIKLLVNLIPFNDIGHPTYRRPSDKRVREFQESLWERGVFVHVRSTRGDDESAACGQLATNKRRERQIVK